VGADVDPEDALHDGEHRGDGAQNFLVRSLSGSAAGSLPTSIRECLEGLCVHSGIRAAVRRRGSLQKRGGAASLMSPAPPFGAPSPCFYIM
jgi:hypothetical protein